MRLVAQRVASERRLQFGDGADIARTQLRNFDGGFTLHDGKMGKLLRGTASKVLDSGIGLERAGKDFEERDVPRERIRDGFENVEGQRLRISNFHAFLSRRSTRAVTSRSSMRHLYRNRSTLRRSRRVGHEKIKQVIATNIS